jgi:hypothetical protein
MGHWYDYGDVRETLEELVARGHAERNIDAQNGYPSIYRMPYNKVLFILQKGISPMTLHGFKLDTEDFFGNQTDMVTITLWDQS